MQVVFRVDASAQIGTGHVMRCLTLADALKASGSNSLFICNKLPTQLHNLLKTRGHDIAVITNKSAKALNMQIEAGYKSSFDWETDAKQTISTINSHTIDWLIVDHYSLDTRWESYVRSKCNRLMVIDDLADRKHDCELLLDQSLHENYKYRYRNLVPAHCRLLLGPKHVLLQPSFNTLNKRVRTGRVSRILVFFGGNDLSNQAGIAIQALINFPKIFVEVVLGLNHPHKASVFANAAKASHITVVETCSDMAQSMANADLALGACGMAGWERCAMKLPTIVCIIAENQRQDTLAMHHKGAVENLGDACHLTAGDWNAAITRALADPARLIKMSRAASNLVKGHKNNFELLLSKLNTRYDQSFHRLH